MLHISHLSFEWGLLYNQLIYSLPVTSWHIDESVNSNLLKQLIYYLCRWHPRKCKNLLCQFPEHITEDSCLRWVSRAEVGLAVMALTLLCCGCDLSSFSVRILPKREQYSKMKLNFFTTQLQNEVKYV